MLGREVIRIRARPRFAPDKVTNCSMFSLFSGESTFLMLRGRFNPLRSGKFAREAVSLIGLALEDDLT